MFINSVWLKDNTTCPFKQNRPQHNYFSFVLELTSKVHQGFYGEFKYPVFSLWGHKQDQYYQTHVFRGQHRGRFLFLKMCQNSKSQIVTKLKNTNCDTPKTSNRDKTKKKNVMWPISNSTKKSKNLTLTKSKISNCDKTQLLKLYKTQQFKLWQLLNTQFWQNSQTNIL